MAIGTALSFALQAMELMPLVVQGVVGAVDAFNAGREAVQRMRDENRDPTPEEWHALNNATQALQNRLHSDTN